MVRLLRRLSMLIEFLKLFDKIMAIADKYGIPVVEDAAEGMGSRFNG